MEHLRCVVERITYQNAENGYTVLKCAAKNYNDLVTVSVPCRIPMWVLFFCWKAAGRWTPDTEDSFQWKSSKRRCLPPYTALRNISAPG